MTEDIYHWGIVYDFEFNPINTTAEPTFSVSSLTRLTDDSFIDQELMVDCHDLTTPIGICPRNKYDICRVYEWLLIFKIFQHGALRSIESEYFKALDRQEPWYILACEHEQYPCIVMEYNNTHPYRRLDYGKLIDEKVSIYDNLAQLVANSCIETPETLLRTWMESDPQLRKYARLINDHDTLSLEKEIASTLMEWYRAMAEHKIKCGGLYFEWYAANPGKAEAVGVPFIYDAPIGEAISF